MKGQRFKLVTQCATTAIAVSPELRKYIQESAQPREAADDTLRRLLGLPPRDIIAGLPAAAAGTLTPQPQ